MRLNQLWKARSAPTMAHEVRIGVAVIRVMLKKFGI
jgi:hypothetical protein